MSGLRGQTRLTDSGGASGAPPGPPSRGFGRGSEVNSPPLIERVRFAAPGRMNRAPLATVAPSHLAAERGFTYLEMVATAAILMILASAVLPMARIVRTRQKEIELRRSLRIIRTAVDDYKKAVDTGKIGGTDVKVGSEGYPPDLTTLVKGVSQVG